MSSSSYYYYYYISILFWPIIIIEFNSIYLCAKLNSHRPITKLAQVVQIVIVIELFDFDHYYYYCILVLLLLLLLYLRCAMCVIGLVAVDSAHKYEELNY
jgi:hypothetical protein